MRSQNSPALSQEESRWKHNTRKSDLTCLTATYVFRKNTSKRLAVVSSSPSSTHSPLLWKKMLVDNTNKPRKRSNSVPNLVQHSRGMICQFSDGHCFKPSTSLFACIRTSRLAQQTLPSKGSLWGTDTVSSWVQQSEVALGYSTCTRVQGCVAKTSLTQVFELWNLAPYKFKYVCRYI